MKPLKQTVRDTVDSHRIKASKEKNSEDKKETRTKIKNAKMPKLKTYHGSINTKFKTKKMGGVIVFGTGMEVAGNYLFHFRDGRVCHLLRRV